MHFFPVLFLFVAFSEAMKRDGVETEEFNAENAFKCVTRVGSHFPKPNEAMVKLVNVDPERFEKYKAESEGNYYSSYSTNRYSPTIGDTTVFGKECSTMESLRHHKCPRDVTPKVVQVELKNLKVEWVARYEHDEQDFSSESYMFGRQAKKRIWNGVMSHEIHDLFVHQCCCGEPVQLRTACSEVDCKEIGHEVIQERPDFYITEKAECCGDKLGECAFIIDRCSAEGFSPPSTGSAEGFSPPSTGPGEKMKKEEGTTTDTRCDKHPANFKPAKGDKLNGITVRNGEVEGKHIEDTYCWQANEDGAFGSTDIRTNEALCAALGYTKGTPEQIKRGGTESISFAMFGARRQSTIYQKITGRIIDQERTKGCEAKMCCGEMTIKEVEEAGYYDANLGQGYKQCCGKAVTSCGEVKCRDLDQPRAEFGEGEIKPEFYHSDERTCCSERLEECATYHRGKYNEKKKKYDGIGWCESPERGEPPQERTTEKWFEVPSSETNFGVWRALNSFMKVCCKPKIGHTCIDVGCKDLNHQQKTPQENKLRWYDEKTECCGDEFDSCEAVDCEELNHYSKEPVKTHYEKDKMDCCGASYERCPEKDKVEEFCKGHKRSTTKEPVEEILGKYKVSGDKTTYSSATIARNGKGEIVITKSNNGEPSNAMSDKEFFDGKKNTVSWKPYTATGKFSGNKIVWSTGKTFTKMFTDEFYDIKNEAMQDKCCGKEWPLCDGTCMVNGYMPREHAPEHNEEDFRYDPAKNKYTQCCEGKMGTCKDVKCETQFKRLASTSQNWYSPDKEEDDCCGEKLCSHEDFKGRCEALHFGKPKDLEQHLAPNYETDGLLWADVCCARPTCSEFVFSVKEQACITNNNNEPAFQADEVPYQDDAITRKAVINCCKGCNAFMADKSRKSCVEVGYTKAPKGGDPEEFSHNYRGCCGPATCKSVMANDECGTLGKVHPEFFDVIVELAANGLSQSREVDNEIKKRCCQHKCEGDELCQGEKQLKEANKGKLVGKSDLCCEDKPLPLCGSIKCEALEGMKTPETSRENVVVEGDGRNCCDEKDKLCKDFDCNGIAHSRDTEDEVTIIGNVHRTHNDETVGATEEECCRPRTCGDFGDEGELKADVGRFRNFCIGFKAPEPNGKLDGMTKAQEAQIQLGWMKPEDNGFIFVPSFYRDYDDIKYGEDPQNCCAVECKEEFCVGSSQLIAGKKIAQTKKECCEAGPIDITPAKVCKTEDFSCEDQDPKGRYTQKDGGNIKGLPSLEKCCMFVCPTITEMPEGMCKEGTELDITKNGDMVTEKAECCRPIDITPAKVCKTTDFSCEDQDPKGRYTQKDGEHMLAFLASLENCCMFECPTITDMPEGMCKEGTKLDIAKNGKRVTEKAECCRAALCTEYSCTETHGEGWTNDKEATEGHRRDVCCVFECPAEVPERDLCAGVEIDEALYKESSSGKAKKEPQDCCYDALKTPEKEIKVPQCKDFSCADKEMPNIQWKNKDGNGSSRKECCMLKCPNLNNDMCAEGSQVLDETKTETMVAEMDECCREKRCSDFNCKESEGLDWINDPKTLMTPLRGAGTEDVSESAKQCCMFECLLAPQDLCASPMVLNEAPPEPGHFKDPQICCHEPPRDLLSSKPDPCAKWKTEATSEDLKAMGVLELCTKEQDVGKQCIIPEQGGIGVGICDDSSKCNIEEAVTTCKGSTLCATCIFKTEPPPSSSRFSSSRRRQEPTSTSETSVTVKKTYKEVSTFETHFSKSVGVCLDKASFEQDEKEVKAGNFCMSAHVVEIYYKRQSELSILVREEITRTRIIVTGGEDEECNSHEKCGTGKFCDRDWGCSEAGKCSYVIERFGGKNMYYPIDGTCPDMAAVAEYEAQLAANKIRRAAEKEEKRKLELVKKGERSTRIEQTVEVREHLVKKTKKSEGRVMQKSLGPRLRRR